MAKTHAHGADVTPAFLKELKDLQQDYDLALAEWERAREKAALLKKAAEEKAEDLHEFIRKAEGTLPLLEGAGEKGKAT